MTSCSGVAEAGTVRVGDVVQVVALRGFPTSVLGVERDGQVIRLLTDIGPVVVPGSLLIPCAPVSNLL